MASNYGSNILQSMGNYRQEELARQERDRANQPNLLAGLAGLLSGAVSSGQVSPDKGWGNLGVILSSPEAWGGALTGVMQPTAGTTKDLFTGGIAGIQSAKEYKALENTQRKEKEKEALDLLSNFDFVTKDTQGAFDLHDYSSYFPVGTYVARKQPDITRMLYDPETRALMGLSALGTPNLPPPKSGFTRMKGPDGTIEDVPRKNVAKAKAAGYLEVQ